MPSETSREITYKLSTTLSRVEYLHLMGLLSLVANNSIHYTPAEISLASNLLAVWKSE